MRSGGRTLNTSSLEKLAENGKYTDVVAALHEACLALTFDEIQKRFRKNDIPFEKSNR